MALRGVAWDIDGTLVETTPVAKPIDVAPGKHAVVFKHPNAPDVTRHIEAIAGKTILLDIEMQVTRPTKASRRDGGTCRVLTCLPCVVQCDLPTMVERMSVAPACVFGLPGGSLKPGSPADVTVMDPSATWTVEARRFLSKSRNTPFKTLNKCSAQTV